MLLIGTMESKAHISRLCWPRFKSLLKIEEKASCKALEWDGFECDAEMCLHNRRLMSRKVKRKIYTADEASAIVMWMPFSCQSTIGNKMSVLRN